MKDISLFIIRSFFLAILYLWLSLFLGIILVFFFNFYKWSILTTLLFCFLLSIVLFVNKKWPTTYKQQLFLSIVIALSCLSLYQNITFLYSMPKITRLSKNWSISGDTTKIEGYNFGDPQNSGVVYFNEHSFIIKKWNDNQISIVQPVLPEETGVLFIQTKTQKKSNTMFFELKNPADVL